MSIYNGGMGSDNQHLSHISTLWTLVRRAHGSVPEALASAQERLLERYSAAIHRYLLGALRDAEAADELFQEFALRFLRGDFRNANPEKGRFRDFVKTSLFHLIVDFQKRQKKRPQSLDADVHAPAVAPLSQLDNERAFAESWKQDLMDRTWQALAELEKQTRQPAYTVLRFRTDHPLLDAADLAEQLGAKLGKSFTIDGVRKALQRAREKFVDLLVQEVTSSLDSPSREELEDELKDLDLYTYCRPALERQSER